MQGVQSLEEKRKKMADNERDFTYDKNVLLGNGDYAYVFRGRFRGEDVAVKRVQLLSNMTSKTDKEAEAHRNLNDHVNVVRLLETRDSEDGNLR